MINKICITLEKRGIKTKLNTIYVKTIGFGILEGNPVRCTRCFRNKRLIGKYLVQRYSFRNHWYNELFETIIADEMAQKVNAV